jgi:hypothetical protein
MTIDLSTSAASRSTTSKSSIGSPAHTCSAASRLKFEAKVLRRRKAIRSVSPSRSWLQSMAASSVCWRLLRERDAAASSLKRSPRRCAIWAGDIERTRAAASSMASGMPSRRRQMAITSATLAGVTWKSVPASRARSWNSLTAPKRRLSSGSSPGAGRAKGRQPVQRFAVHPEQLAARGQDAQAGQARSSRCGQGSHRLQDVLAVVQQQQDAALGDAGSQGLEKRHARDGTHAEPVGDLVDEDVAVVEGGQLDEVDAVGSSRPPPPPPAGPGGSCPCRPGR